MKNLFPDADSKLASRKFKKRWLFPIALLILFATLIGAIKVNHYLTTYEISYDVIGEVHKFQHEDGRSTNNYNYLIRAGALPEKEKLPLYRQYIRDVRTDAGMEVPKNIFHLRKETIDDLAIEWYTATFPDGPTDDKSLHSLIQTLFEQAIKPALDKQTIRGPEDEMNLWLMTKDVGSPKLRWVGEDEDFVTFLIVYSGGEKRSFYDPIGNTIYLSYSKSVYSLADEVGHVEQFRKQPIRSYLRLGWSVLRASIKSLFEERSPREIYVENYRQEGLFEHEAHNEIKRHLLEKHHLEHLFSKDATK